MSGREPIVHVRKSMLLGMLDDLDAGRYDAFCETLGAAADRGDEKAVQDLRTLEEMIRAAYAEVRE